MPDLLTNYGLVSLFLLSFCASTLLPLGSEWLLVALLLKGASPFDSVAVATLGNSLGALTSYAIGRWSRNLFFIRIFRTSPAQQQKAEQWFDRYGSWALLFSWLPLIGDPLCLVAGSLRTSLISFILLVTTGKCLRYISVALLTLQSSH